MLLETSFSQAQRTAVTTPLSDQEKTNLFNNLRKLLSYARRYNSDPKTGFINEISLLEFRAYIHLLLPMSIGNPAFGLEFKDFHDRLSSIDIGKIYLLEPLECDALQAIGFMGSTRPHPEMYRDDSDYGRPLCEYKFETALSRSKLEYELYKVDLKKSNLQHIGLRELKLMLASCRAKEINLSGNYLCYLRECRLPLNFQAYRIIFRSIEDVGRNLSKLLSVLLHVTSINLSDNHLDALGVQGIIFALSRLPSNIKEVILSDNNFHRFPDHEKLKLKEFLAHYSEINGVHFIFHGNDPFEDEYAKHIYLRLEGELEDSSVVPATAPIQLPTASAGIGVAPNDAKDNQPLVAPRNYAKVLAQLHKHPWCFFEKGAIIACIAQKNLAQIKERGTTSTEIKQAEARVSQTKKEFSESCYNHLYLSSKFNDYNLHPVNKSFGRKQWFKCMLDPLQWALTRSNEWYYNAERIEFRQRELASELILLQDPYLLTACLQSLCNNTFIGRFFDKGYHISDPLTHPKSPIVTIIMPALKTYFEAGKPLYPHPELAKFLNHEDVKAALTKVSPALADAIYSQVVVPATTRAAATSSQPAVDAKSKDSKSTPTMTATDHKETLAVTTNTSMNTTTTAATTGSAAAPAVLTSAPTAVATSTAVVMRATRTTPVDKDVKSTIAHINPKSYDAIVSEGVQCLQQDPKYNYASLFGMKPARLYATKAVIAYKYARAADTDEKSKPAALTQCRAACTDALKIGYFDVATIPDDLFRDWLSVVLDDRMWKIGSLSLFRHNVEFQNKLAFRLMALKEIDIKLWWRASLQALSQTTFLGQVFDVGYIASSPLTHPDSPLVTRVLPSLAADATTIIRFSDIAEIEMIRRDNKIMEALEQSHLALATVLKNVGTDETSLVQAGTGLEHAEGSAMAFYNAL